MFILSYAKVISSHSGTYIKPTWATERDKVKASRLSVEMSLSGIFIGPLGDWRKCAIRAQLFSSDWRYVAFLQTLVALKKAGCGLVLMALHGKKPVVVCGKWNVRQATLQQMFKLTTVCTDTCFQFFRHWSTALSTTLCWNSAHVAKDAYATRPYRGLVLGTREKN